MKERPGQWELKSKNKMGKTKTAFVSGVEEEKKSSEERYREKKAAAAKALAAKEKIHIAGLKGGQRIKAVEAGPIITEETEKKTEVAEKKHKAPKKRGKKYQNAKTKIDSTKKYPAGAAIKSVKETSYSAFDGTVELHLVIKKKGLSLQVALPYSAGREKKIEVASETTLKKLEAGKIDFDLLIATPEMMPKLVPFAKILGPKGLMPNPKNGTLVQDAKAVQNFSAASINLKTEKEAPLIHTVIGKVSQKDAELLANLEAIIAAVGEKQIVKAYLKATMGPSVKLII